MRGFAYSGAFAVLDSMGILKDIDRVGGTSAVAIEATLLAVGYTPDEITASAYKAPLQHFNDAGFLYLGTLKRFREQFGLFKGDKISSWIGELIAAKTGNGNITFGELHRERVSKGYKDLYITGADLTYQCLRIFSWENYPGMRVKDAVRISVSIPLYFRPVLMDDTGRVYSKSDPDKILHVMTDGGVLSNYPLFMFDSARYMPAGYDTTQCRLENPETLGLLMEVSEQLDYNRYHKGNYPIDILTMHDYFKALFHTVIDKANPEMNGTYLLRRTIAIDDLGLSPKIKKLPKKTIEGLVESGKEGARRFFRLN